ncbi:hypothetical protein [Lactovum odontotermitis]
MTYDVAAISFVTFLLMMVYLEKGKVPEILRKGSFLKVIPILLLFIVMMQALSVLTHVLYFPVIASIMSGCLLLWRFKRHVEH